MSVVAGMIAAWYTNRISRKKSNREEWQELYMEMKTRTDEAEKRNHELIMENEQLRIENAELKSQLKS
ncbi:hypothetical protein [Levilactobacillus brevis]|uniref:hypothetical protein n=1 Tax=Levilactobacillus brevis TaxID=1580 RepID=UPI000A2F95AE|nr:hypothetical protein [Levilactobacillus brevis]ARQ94258.1 hypothetical protein A6F60_11370 [Levilactobacillus brevis]MUV40460.1 hypothetical protein [Levilactobacillus brevis]